MATRSGAKHKSLEEAQEYTFKCVGRTWTFWLIGIVIGAIGLKPTSVSAVGLSLSIERPEIIQGIVYWIALYYAFTVCINAGPQANFPRPRSMRRYFLWSALPRGTRSLRGMTKADVVAIKAKATKIAITITALPIIIVAIPIIGIVLFNPIKMIWTLLALVGIM